MPVEECALPILPTDATVKPPLSPEVRERLARSIDRCITEQGMGPLDISDFVISTAIECGFDPDDPDIEQLRKAAVDLAWTSR